MRHKRGVLAPEIDTGSAAQIRFALIPPKGRVLNDAASFLHDLSPTGFLLFISKAASRVFDNHSSLRKRQGCH
jgi:hypothetical protein